MRLNLPIFIYFFLLTFCLQAQSSFHVSAAYATKQGRIDKEIAPSVLLRNLSNKTIQLRWEISKANLSEGWSAVVCDHQCYTNLVSEKTFELKPGSVLQDFKVSFRPNGKEGMGNYTINLYELNNRSSSEQTITFNAAANSVVSSTNSLINQPNPPKVFPNPAIEYIYLNDESARVKSIEIYNVVGRKMQKLTVNNSNERFNINNLPRGIYMIRMLDKQGHIVRTQRISKYNP
jgi:hypothetical protein